MAENSGIQWTHHTFNPWRGCTKVHEGCARCYAESNFSVKLHGIKWGPDGTRVRLSNSGWAQPLKWNRAAEKAGERHRVFCASLADVFEDWQGPILNHKGNRYWYYPPKRGYLTLPAYTEEPQPGMRPATMADLRRDLFRLIDATPHLDWLLLTKRPENVPGMFLDKQVCLCGEKESHGGAANWTCSRCGTLNNRWHRHNVWLGTSVSNQETADAFVPRLLLCRDLCPVLFLSCEPLLGPVDLQHLDTGRTWAGKSETAKLDCLRGFTSSRRERFTLNGIVEEKGVTPFVDVHDTGRISWVIVGGESDQGGKKARPCDPNWVRLIVEQCEAAGVPCFVKQMGSTVLSFASPLPGPQSVESLMAQGEYDPEPHAWSLQDSHGGDPAEWPEDLRVRQFPEVAHT